MAKKKEISIKATSTRGAGPDADPSDPVTIVYNADLIGSLNKSETEGTLKTGGTICEHDINIRYAPTATPVIINVNDSGPIASQLKANNLIVEDAFVTFQYMNEGANTLYAFPTYDSRRHLYALELAIPDNTNALNVTATNAEVSHSGTTWNIVREGSTNFAGEAITITITGAA